MKPLGIRSYDAEAFIRCGKVAICGAAVIKSEVVAKVTQVARNYGWLWPRQCKEPDFGLSFGKSGKSENTSNCRLSDMGLHCDSPLLVASSAPVCPRRVRSRFGAGLSVIAMSGAVSLSP